MLTNNEIFTTYIYIKMLSKRINFGMTDKLSTLGMKTNFAIS